MVAALRFAMTFLLGGLLDFAKPLARRVLLALGLSFVSYVGVKAALDYALGLAASQLSGLPADLLPILGALQVDVCLSMYVSAVGMCATISGLSATGALTRLVRGG